MYCSQFLSSRHTLHDNIHTAYLPAEAVNLLYFSRYKLKYLSQFAEYNCNQGVLRKVTLSSKTYLFLILKVELHFNTYYIDGRLRRIIIAILMKECDIINRDFLSDDVINTKNGDSSL